MQQIYSKIESNLKRDFLRGEHPDTALILNNLAGLYVRQGRDEEAEPLYVQALRIFEQRLGKEHPDTLMVREIYEDFKRNREREGG
jgi:Tetratricopeptide repeat